MSQVTITVGKLKNQYVSAQGTPTFVYPISGEADALEAYKTSKGTYYREDEGVALFFSTTPLEEGTEMTQNTKGNFSVKTDLIEAVNKSNDLRDGYVAKFAATQQFLGLTKKQMQDLLIAQLAG